MNCSSCLADNYSGLVLDTSAIINLHASGVGSIIISALPNAVFVTTLVVADLDHETSKSNGEHEFLHTQISQGQINEVDLAENEWSIFESLVSLPLSVGDGEASVIAVAKSRELIPVLDDGRARKHALSLCGHSTLAWSLDLFIHPHVEAALKETLTEAIFMALREGRMRIDDSRCDTVIDLLGRERASQCPSLPNFKSRKANWQLS